MVLTGRVGTNTGPLGTGPGRAAGHTRRGVLAATGTVAAGATLAGCGLFGDDGPEPAPAPDPLQPLLDEALALAAAHDRARLTQTALSARLTPLAEDHRAHAAALAQVIGSTPPSGPATAPASAAPAGGSAAATLAELRKAEQAAQKTAVAACRAATPDRAALVGSIAACRATHIDALR